MEDSKETEKKEIDAISDSPELLMLGGKLRRLHVGMKGWKVINPELGGLESILKKSTENPEAFLFDILPRLVQVAIEGGEGEKVELDTVLDWLDMYGMNDLKNKVVPAVMGAIMNSLPQGTGNKNPRKAKP